MPALNFSDITKAVVDLIQNGCPYQVERGSFVNADAGVAVDGWVGVYRGPIEYIPQTMSGRAFSVTGEVVIIVQAASAGTADDVEDLLEIYLSDVITAVDADKTLGGTVTMLTGYGIEYSYASRDSGSLHFQWATIRARFDKRVQL